MATQKNINTVTAASDLATSDYIIISKNGSSVQRVPYTVLMNSLIGDFSATVGFHNGIYRGKNITSYFTDGTLWKRIDGTNGYSLFEDLYLGDYIIIGNNSYTIVDFDYYYKCGYDKLSAHHLVMMPTNILVIPEGTALYGSSDTLSFIDADGVTYKETSSLFKWNATEDSPNTSTTKGGYKFSRIRTIIMKAADTIITEAFGADHIYPIGLLYPDPGSATDSGIAYNREWFNDDSWSSVNRKSICDLPNETQIWGQQIYGKGSTYLNTCHEIQQDRYQFSICRLQRDFVCVGTDYWLRSVFSDSQVAIVSYSGAPSYGSAAKRSGVRPRFILIA